jgi:DNA-binding XRE family transcriptional regulator
MPRSTQTASTAKNHEDGNHPRTTALETAVRPTPAASAISRRPTASAKTTAGVTGLIGADAFIIPQYPQFVDGCKTTIRGLVTPDIFVNAPDARELVFMYEEIGRRLKRIREHYSDLNQKAWAEKHGFNVTQYNNWEKGVRRIPVEAAEKLCDTYGLTLDFIYRDRRDGLSETSRKMF